MSHQPGPSTPGSAKKPPIARRNPAPLQNRLYNYIVEEDDWVLVREFVDETGCRADSAHKATRRLVEEGVIQRRPYLPDPRINELGLTHWEDERGPRQ